MAALIAGAVGHLLEIPTSSFQSIHLPSEMEKHLLILLTFLLIFTSLVFTFKWILPAPNSPTLSACKVSQGPTRDTMCSYCWDKIKSTDITLVHGICNNSWHQDCLAAISKASHSSLVLCPLCRTPMNKADFLSIRQLKVILPMTAWNRMSSKTFKTAMALTIYALAIHSASIQGPVWLGPLSFAYSPTFTITLAAGFVVLASQFETLNFLARLFSGRPFGRCLIRFALNALGLVLLSGTGLIIWTQDYSGSYWDHVKSSDDAVALISVYATMALLLVKLCAIISPSGQMH